MQHSMYRLRPGHVHSDHLHSSSNLHAMSAACSRSTFTNQRLVLCWLVLLPCPAARLLGITENGPEVQAATSPSGK